MTLLIASLIAQAPVKRALRVRLAFSNSMLLIGTRLMMVIGICPVPQILTITRGGRG
jgi:hypothetical protein